MAWIQSPRPISDMVCDHACASYALLKPAYALISATGIFFLGCCASLFHGFSTLAHPEPLESLTLAMSVISGTAGCITLHVQP